MSGGILPVRRIAKPWGRTELPAPFASNANDRIGEIWFEPPPELDTLLAKYLFTSEKLSVQVHPSDNQVQNECGKDECWLILEAEPGASVAAGFVEPTSREQMRSTASNGTIENLLSWHEVTRGDFIYIPAGTVHAIGPGIALVEIQQNCDTTYRLFDYGRPRDLHLDEAIGVARGEPHPAAHRRRVGTGAGEILLDGPYFRVGHCQGAPGEELTEKFTGPCLIMSLEGDATIAGSRVDAGCAGWVSQLSDATFAGDGRFLFASSVNGQD